MHDFTQPYLTGGNKVAANSDNTGGLIQSKKLI